MIKYGLPENTIYAIQQVFAKHQGIEKAILYGSRAKGTYKNGSDIDITLSGPSLSINSLLRIENELDDLLLPYKFDLSIFHHISNPELLDHIQRIGVLFYTKEINPT